MQWILSISKSQETDELVRDREKILEKILSFYKIGELMKGK